MINNRRMIKVEYDTIEKLTDLIYELEKSSIYYEYHIKVNNETGKYMMLIEELFLDKGMLNNED